MTPEPPGHSVDVQPHWTVPANAQNLFNGAHLEFAGPVALLAAQLSYWLLCP